jgi:hypothetical protein
MACAKIIKVLRSFANLQEISTQPQHPSNYPVTNSTSAISVLPNFKNQKEKAKTADESSSVE